MKNTYKDLGYESYEHYLRSPHWLTFRARVLARPQNRKCHVCGSSPVELHHLTYKWLGREDERSVAVVCNTCHGELHELEQEGRMDYVWRVIQWKRNDPVVLEALQGKRLGPVLLWWYGREEERLAKEAIRAKAESDLRELLERMARTQELLRQRRNVAAPEVTSVDKLKDTGSAILVVLFWVALFLGMSWINRQG